MRWNYVSILKLQNPIVAHLLMGIWLFDHYEIKIESNL